MANEVDVWVALGDATRRKILEHLAGRPQAVGELAEGLPVSRPAVSQHLRVLKEAGLVTDRTIGTRHIYEVNPEGVDLLRSRLEQFWSKALAAHKDAAEKPQRRPHGR